MSTAPPRLLPIFRSDTQFQVLGATYLEPERQFTIPELIARAQRPQPTVAREVDRLVEAGLLESELRGGRRTVWAATTTPIFGELRSILLKTIGPKAVLQQQYQGVPGINSAMIYGSWARRYAGESGPMPQDIDLMIVGTADVNTVRKKAELGSCILGRDVNVTVLSPNEWATAGSGFIANLKDGPLVELDLTR